MNSYSQNSEDLIVYRYFGDFIGSLLELGANDGKTLSNSLGLIEIGWKAVLVEPNIKSFEKLSKLHKNNKNVHCLPFAISDESGELDFYESGSHLSDNDHSLLSSLNPDEILRWGNTAKFTLTKVPVITFDIMLEKSPIKEFDFISIDCEGVDMVILRQIDLSKTKMICIEWNNKLEVKNEIIRYCSKFGLNRIMHTNYENIIIAR